MIAPADHLTEGWATVFRFSNYHNGRHWNTALWEFGPGETRRVLVNADEVVSTVGDFEPLQPGWRAHLARHLRVDFPPEEAAVLMSRLALEPEHVWACMRWFANTRRWQL